MPDRLTKNRLCLHTVTTKPWSLEECCRHYAGAGIAHITVWRNVLEGIALPRARKLFADHGLAVAALCRGGFFASSEASQRRAALADNRLALEQAAAIGAPTLVLVCGADPGQSLDDSRHQIRDGIAAILPAAESLGVVLAIEPLHPMYAGDRSAVVTLAQANDLAQFFDSPWAGVALDVYHVWWDPALQQEMERCAKAGFLRSFHVSDWKTPTADLLNDRGLMGEGCIPLRSLREQAEANGFRGPVEVEIFSTEYWKLDQEIWLQWIIEAYIEHC
ncbi:MAG TPA: sugar phosphate isomerase/epimerase family protein [Verrucomicrobiales bacterium]|nr:sugar phosphate isomerase/epimerase family protein [Verrucomicrobiales bacterium]